VIHFVSFNSSVRSTIISKTFSGATVYSIFPVVIYAEVIAIYIRLMILTQESQAPASNQKRLICPSLSRAYLSKWL
jgi:hypothetical protein